MEAKDLASVLDMPNISIWKKNVEPLNRELSPSPKPSLEEAPQLELKKLPSHLRFSDAAYLLSVGQLDIHGRIGTEMLSPKTEYAAYLVFNLLKWSCGLESAKSSIRFVNYESEIDTEKQSNTVHFARSKVSGDIPKIRGGGWMEVELGYCNSKKGTNGPVEARLIEMKHISKGGLIVEGIDFRPR
ncbi:F-box protein VBF-like [Solanum dulcamara]|uniref:F-box protein VBF-like n=1 Tax=Solanum dulcamara TaxID=45834 RepID=UPI0024866090|nr:F-box protein VBF-like [Solanum dulcamara]